MLCKGMKILYITFQLDTILLEIANFVDLCQKCYVAMKVLLYQIAYNVRSSFFYVFSFAILHIFAL